MVHKIVMLEVLFRSEDVLYVFLDTEIIKLPLHNAARYQNLNLTLTWKPGSGLFTYISSQFLFLNTNAMPTIICFILQYKLYLCFIFYSHLKKLLLSGSSVH